MNYTVPFYCCLKIYLLWLFITASGFTPQPTGLEGYCTIRGGQAGGCQTLWNTYLWNCSTDCNCATYGLNLGFSMANVEKPYHRNKRADWHGMKGMWIDRKWVTLCGFELWPHPWPWPSIFKVRFWKSHIPGIGGSIDMARNGCEWIESWTHFVTLNFDFIHGLDLGF